MRELVYILEDEAEIARIMRRALEQQGYELEWFHQRAQFAHALARRRPDLCLVDLELPDGDGLSLVRDLLHRDGIPAIIVTGRGELTDRLIGLEVGADDYIVKPFEPRELVARARAVLRRGGDGREPGPGKPQRFARFEGWVADFGACTLTAPDGEVMPLSAAETALLRIFAEAAGRVLSRAALLDLEDQDDLDAFDRSMDVRVSRLRKKLRGGSETGALIRTVYGVGYVFTPVVAWSGDPTG